jgi:hypothetical protein
MINYTITASNRDSFFEQVKKLDPTVLWEATIVERRSKLSAQQRKWARKFAAEFGKQIGYDPDEAYDLLMYKCNPVFKVDPVTQEEIRLPGHLTPKDTKIGAEVQERMIRFGESLGFYFEDR